MDKRRVRIADIAEELGVSTATVSNVIHGKTKKISDETVKRVQELLEKRQYIPSMAGILLAQNDSRIIGIVVNNHEKYENHALEDAFIASSLNALSLELNRSGYFMMVKVTADWNEIPRFASMWNMDGLVVMGFCEQDYQKLRESMHIPFVVYDGYFTKAESICNLIIDNYDGGRQVGAYLRDMGHRQVLCIADNFSCMDRERIEGCQFGLGESRIDFMQIPMIQKERRQFYQEKASCMLRHSAIFAASDYYAAELIYFLAGAGIHVPGDISVVGFDDIPLCGHMYPPLTSVKQDVMLRARQAVRVLNQLKAGICESTVIKMPVSLVKRESVKQLV
ncbi:MAG: LacI family transcriptional regulator [Lachnospiraceae bacterium]|nr:LacI family transcriptional regulator [Lachnospiraceae bacterium]